MKIDKSFWKDTFDAVKEAEEVNENITVIRIPAKPGRKTVIIIPDT